MDNQRKQVIGSWIAAVGTVTAAIGSTPFQCIRDEMRYGLNIWGNVLQAAGNALQADGEKKITFEKVGNEIQSIGNVMVFAGLLIDFEGDIEKRFIITGNWMQALGGAAALGEGLENPNAVGQSYNIAGNFLQVIGNSLQALGDISDLRESADKQEEDEQNRAGSQEATEEKKNTNVYGDREEATSSQGLNISGSWIQAVGSVLSFIGQIKETREEEKKAE